MADKIVSWGGIESKSTSGMSVTGSLSVVGSSSFGYGNIASGNTYIKIDPNQFNSRITFNDFDGGIGSRGGELEMGTYYSSLMYGSYNWFYIGNSSYRYLFYIGDNRRILISEASSKPTNTTAMLTVRGTGTTSSTTSLLVQDSSGNSAFAITDDRSATIYGPLNLSRANQGFIYYTANDYIAFPRQGGAAPGYFSTSTAGDGWAFTLAANGQTYARIMEGSFYLEAFTPNGNGRNSIKTWFSGSNFVYIDGDGVLGKAPSYGNGVNVIIRGGKSGGYDNVDNRGATGYVTIEGGSAFSSSFTTHVPAAGVNIQTGLGLGTGSAADLTFSTSTTSSVASVYHTQTQRMVIKGQTGNIGIGTSVPSASLHISGSSNSVLFEVDSPAQNNILYVSGSGNVLIGTNTPEASTTAPLYIYKGPSNSGRSGITIHSGQSAANGSFLHLFNYISHWASGIQHYSAGGGAIQKMRFYIGYDASQQLGDGGNIMTISSNGLGINTLAAEISAILQVKGSGATSSTTALLVQNSAATENFRIYDNGNITVGLGTTTFSSAGWGGGSSPSSSIYFNNAINDHETNHEIRIRASLQGNPYNRILLPTGYGGTYSFIGAGNGVVLALSNSGSGYIMNYSNTGITANSGQNVYSNNTSTRTSVFGGGTNDVHHLAPFSITLQGNTPFDSASAANGGDVYVRAGGGSGGTSGVSGSVYLLGSTISLSGSVVITGSLTVSGSNITSAWTAYTPTWTAASSNPAIGNGTIEGYYKVVGKTCFVRGNIAMGSTTTFGSGEWYVSMPFTASHADAILITANLLDNGTASYNATMNGARAGFNYKSTVQYQAVGGTADSITPTTPFTWTNTDRFIWNGSYEIA